VYAKRSCPAGDPCDLLALLHGPHRIGCRLVMILLSHHGWSAATIAELLGCDPRERSGLRLRPLVIAESCAIGRLGRAAATNASG
jgi:hypothetical protein